MQSQARVHNTKWFLAEAGEERDALTGIEIGNFELEG